MIMAYEAPAIEQQGDSLRKGPWHEEEDERLVSLVNVFGERKWDSIGRISGLKRSGKSCRMRWLNYLRPSLKRCRITPEEEQVILQLHHQWGNKWSRIARSLPGRTDNEIKNYWRTHLSKKPIQGQQEEEASSRHEPGEDLALAQNGSFVMRPEHEYDDSWKLMDSTYETRLYEHWMSEIELGDNKVEAKGCVNGCLEECFGFCTCNGSWDYQVCENSVLDCLWEHS